MGGSASDICFTTAVDVTGRFLTFDSNDLRRAWYSPSARLESPGQRSVSQISQSKFRISWEGFRDLVFGWQVVSKSKKWMMK